MKLPQLQLIDNAIRRKFPWKKYSFNTTMNTNLWEYRYLIAAIVCSGNSEKNTLNWMNDENPNPSDMSKMDWKELADRMDTYNLKYTGKKAKEIIFVSQWALENKKIIGKREVLESLPGVGRHVASVILATVYNKPEFGIDFHVKRVLSRFGFKKMSDKALESLVAEKIKPENIGHFSRAFVDFGQNACVTNPNCSACVLSPLCKKVDVVQSKNIIDSQESQEDGVFPFEKYEITVKNGIIKCNCMAGKYNKPCRHKTEFSSKLKVA